MCHRRSALSRTSSEISEFEDEPDREEADATNRLAAFLLTEEDATEETGDEREEPIPADD